MWFSSKNLSSQHPHGGGREPTLKLSSDLHTDTLHMLAHPTHKCDAAFHLSTVSHHGDCVDSLYGTTLHKHIFVLFCFSFVVGSDQWPCVCQTCTLLFSYIPIPSHCLNLL